MKTRTTTNKSFAGLKITRLGLALVAALFVCASLTGCADDNDDFLNRNDKELSDLRKEDAAIRAELRKQIDKNREEFTTKLSSLETALKALIDSEGKALDSYLAEQAEETSRLINQKFDGFDEKVVARARAEREKIEDVGNRINYNVSSLKARLNTAIANGDKVQQAQIEAQIKRNVAVKAGVDHIVGELNSMMARMEAIEAKIQALDDLEHRFDEQDTKFSDQVEDAQERIASLRELLKEDYDEMTATQLEQYNELLEEAGPLVDELTANISRYEDLVSRFNIVQSDLSAGLTDYDLNDLIDRANAAYSQLDALVNLIDPLTYPELDPSDVDLDSWFDEVASLREMMGVIYAGEIEMIYDSSKSEIEGLINTYEEIKEGLADWADIIDSWVNDFLSRLNDAS